MGRPRKHHYTEKKGSSDNAGSKKRGRKPKKNENVTVDLDAIGEESENEELLVQLPIDADDIEKYGSKKDKGVFKKNKKKQKKKDTKSTKVVNIGDSDSSESETTPNNSESTKNSENSDNETSDSGNKKKKKDVAEIFGKKSKHSCKDCRKKDKEIEKLQKIIETFKSNYGNTKIDLGDKLKGRKVTEANVKMVYISKGKTKIKKNKEGLSCFYCTEPFKGEGAVLIDSKVGDKLRVYGCTCSLNCSMTHDIESGDPRTWEKVALYNELYRKITGNDDTLVPAPNKLLLKKFGGKLSIKKFRKNSVIMSKTYRYVIPPMIPIIPVIEEDMSDRSKLSKSTIKYMIAKTASKKKAEKVKETGLKKFRT